MRHSSTAPPAVALSLAVGLAAAGCRSGPVLEGAEWLAEEYWVRHDAPALVEAGYRRVAIVEFSVEYVTQKLEARDDLTGDPPPDPGAPFGLGPQGFTHKRISYDPELLWRLPDELLALFVETLEARGLEVIGPEAVCASASYARLETAERSDSTFLRSLPPGGSDTGRVKATVVYPAPGSQVVEGAWNEEVEAVETDLLDELGADAALRLRVRVGVYDGRATLERGTTVWILTRDAIGNLTAARSLVSDEPVVEEDDLVLRRASTYTVDSARYLSTMRALFPPFVAMALSTGRG